MPAIVKDYGIETYDGVNITLSIDAVGVGNSLVVAVQGGDNVPSMTGFTLDWTGADFYGNAVRIYHLSDITDSRTTINTGVYGLVAFGVLELEGPIVPAMTGAGVSDQTDDVAELSFSTTLDNAVGLAILKVGGYTSTGGGGWVRETPGSNDWNPVYYNADLGSAGTKNTNGISFGTDRQHSVNVMAYAADGGPSGPTYLPAQDVPERRRYITWSQRTLPRARHRPGGGNGFRLAEADFFGAPLSPPVEESSGGGEVGTADEADEALALAGRQVGAVGPSLESDTAAARPGQARGVAGAASESDTSVARQASLRSAVGVATEANTALALSSPAPSIPVGTATETDVATARAGRLVGVVGVAFETDTASARPGLQVGATGVASETDTAAARVGRLSGQAGVATETDSANALTQPSGGFVGLAQETDTAFPRAASLRAPVGVAVESDTAVALSGPQLGTVGLAVEVDTALALLPWSPSLVIYTKSAGAQQVKQLEEDEEDEETPLPEPKKPISINKQAFVQAVAPASVLASAGEPRPRRRLAMRIALLDDE